MYRTPRLALAALAVSLTLGLGACGTETATTTPAATSAPTESTSFAYSPLPQTGEASTQQTSVTATDAGEASSASSTSEPAAAPASFQQSSDITYDGWGKYRLGQTEAQLKAAGAVVPDQCAPEKTPDVHVQLAFGKDRTLEVLMVHDTSAKTAEGAHIGMTFGELKTMYGKGYLELPVALGEGPKVPVAQITDGERSILFGTATEPSGDGSIHPKDVVAWISVQPYLTNPIVGC